MFSERIERSAFAYGADLEGEEGIFYVVCCDEVVEGVVRTAEVDKREVVEGGEDDFVDFWRQVCEHFLCPRCLNWS